MNEERLSRIERMLELSLKHSLLEGKMRDEYQQMQDLKNSPNGTQHFGYWSMLDKHINNFFEMGQELQALKEQMNAVLEGKA